MIAIVLHPYSVSRLKLFKKNKLKIIMISNKSLGMHLVVEHSINSELLGVWAYVNPFQIVMLTNMFMTLPFRGLTCSGGWDMCFAYMTT